MKSAFEVAPAILHDREHLHAKEAEFREELALQARRWVGTPYFPREARCGLGCDCGSLLAGIYRDAGIIGPFRMSSYDWMAAWAVKDGDEIYLQALCAYFHEVAVPRRGDVAMYRLGRGWSHGAIVIQWPGEIIHAGRGYGVIASPGTSGRLAARRMRFWSIFP